ncbi:MAG: hypothetical protein ACRD8A_10305 [Candidatus Acidiferrales bacterium]
MRTRFPLFYALLVVLAAGLPTGSATATAKKAVPPTTKDLVGAWIGFDSDELTFTRLELRSNGTGFCARVSPADTILHSEGVHVYRVTKWSVSGWNIEIHASPLSNAFSIGYIKGRTHLDSLALTIGGPENGGWKESLLLQPESRLQVSDQETKGAIKEVQKGD